MTWLQASYMEVKMKKMEIDIQLDPVKDGASWIPDKMTIKGRGALIIGTNGQYRFAEEDEVMGIFDQLSGCGASDYLGQTAFLVVYNSNKVLYTDDGRFFVGSVVIVKGTAKGTAKGIEFLDEAEIEEVKTEFESRLSMLCGNGFQFSAYEIG